MITMTYCGPLTHLQGLTAIVRPGATAGEVLAQFDDRFATRDGQELSKGWHGFPITDFEKPQQDAGCSMCGD
jgi:hypothetical protein